MKKKKIYEEIKELIDDSYELGYKDGYESNEEELKSFRNDNAEMDESIRRLENELGETEDSTFKFECLMDEFKALEKEKDNVEKELNELKELIGIEEE